MSAFKKTLNGAVGLEVGINESHLDVKATKIEQMDYLKAASSLKIPSQHESKLKKGLESMTAIEGALGAQARNSS